MSIKAGIIKLEEQSDFPLSDLTEFNSEMFGSYWLVHEAGVRAQARILAEHQRFIFDLARTALKFKGIEIADAPDEYRAFRRGFASVEFMVNMLTPLETGGDTAIYNTRQLFMQPGAFVDYELSKRSEKWSERHPNTHSAVVTAGETLGETMAELQSRIIGAQIAYELRDPLAEAA